MASLLEQADLAFKAGAFLKAYDFYCQAHKEYKNDALLTLANECLRKNLPNERLIHNCLRDIKIACIMDEFTWANFSPEANFFPITPENFKNEIEEFKPDLLFIESAWRGKDGLWDLKIAHNPSQEYLELIYFCRYKKIPVIFWNKEDPIHFSVFYKAAKLCDFIFSTDTDSIAKYKYFFAHERVFLLPFACQPLLQNPIENQKPRERAFCYAGSYYERFPEKMRDLDEFVNTLPEFAPVIIYDRNFGKNMPGFSYPADYAAIIRAGLEYDDINIAYKGYEFGINLNSVKNSQSMFARRVFELMASNTLVVSNYSPGIYAFFGDLVFMSDHGKEIIARIEENTQNLDLIRLNALTKVLAEHTYEQRLCYLIEKITGVKRSIPQPLIACFAIVHSKEQIANILANWKCQTYANRSLTILGPGPLMQNLEASEENVLFLQSENLENIETALPNTSNAWLAILSPDVSVTNRKKMMKAVYVQKLRSVEE